MGQKVHLRRLGAWPAWGDDVGLGRLTHDGHAERVFFRDAHTMTPVEAQAVVDALRDVPHPAVLKPIERIDHTLVTEFFEGASLQRMLDLSGDRGSPIPLKALLSVAQQVADLLEALPSLVPMCSHPGVDPGDILVNGGGRIKVAGFRVGQAQNESHASWVLGTLLIELLVGDPSSADAISKVKVRPGEAVPPEVLDLIGDCTSPDPLQRPPLALVTEQLGRAVASLRSTSLSTWASNTIPGVVAKAFEPSRELESEAPTAANSVDLSPVSGDPLFEDIDLDLPWEPSAGSRPMSTDASCHVETVLSEGVAPVSSLTLWEKEHEGLAEPAVPDDLISLSGEFDPPSENVGVPERRLGVFWPALLLVVLVCAAAAGALFAFVDQPLSGAPSIEASPIDPPISSTPDPVGLSDVVVPDPLDEPDAVEEPAETAAANPPVPEAIKGPTPPSRAVISLPLSPPIPLAEPIQEGVGPPNAPPASLSFDARFQVSFTTNNPEVTYLNVRCHQGSGNGPDTVIIPDAGKGPCKVVAASAAGQRVAPVSLTGPRDFICFEGTSRTCE